MVVVRNREVSRNITLRPVERGVWEMTPEHFNHEEIILLEPATLEDMGGLADIIGAFIAAMRRRIPVADEHQAAFERLEQLHTRLANNKGNGMLLQDDFLSIDAALVLFSVFLYLEVPKSERRETVIDGLFQMREHLSVLRRSSPPCMN
jgi:hypothetical protein